MLDNGCDINRKVYFLGDLNIDWLSSSCPLRKKLQPVTSACNLVQVISQPTRVVTNSTGMKSSTCIDHIFTNAAEMRFKAVSRSIGCSDHNIIAISRKTKVPKAGPNIVYKTGLGNYFPWRATLEYIFAIAGQNHITGLYIMCMTVLISTVNHVQICYLFNCFNMHRN